MSGSPSDLSLNKNVNVPEIPIEIVSDEEMALIEAALTAARSISFPVAPTIPSQSSFSQFHRNARSIQSITLLAKRRFSGCTGSDIEDLANLGTTQKKSRGIDSFLHRFRKKRGLAVTDITGTEWCEKQMEFVLLVGRRRSNRAMKAGMARHAELEEEIIEKVKVKVKSREDSWALKLLNFIIGVNQLLTEGLTRELSVIGFVEGIWMVGVIDEIRMPQTESGRNPILVDTKTRVRDTLPTGPQQRNGRLQLMCYKYLWDNLVADKFPSAQFFDFFALNPYYILSEELRETTADAGFPATTLDDVLRYFKNTYSILAPADNKLLLRYEFQKDNMLLGEDQFTYDTDWLKKQIQDCLQFWLGERDANYAPEGERWKCGFCQVASVCPANITDSERTVSPTNNDVNITRS
ncbi:Exonuclease V chloroplastic [Quillaja saponaria]|uniref:Exonuclease V chloroplastic n=1 Tax=Quillaja saponaria TaxID=32244 RepID=A0AAD7VM66_QUISA|nr:Exonuclease V chloroplastic [Quillaja saponaria]